MWWRAGAERRWRSAHPHDDDLEQRRRHDPGNPPDPAALLAKIHAPIAYIYGDAENDIAYPASTQNVATIANVPVFGAWQDHMTHLGTYGQPNGGYFAEIAVSWLDWQLKGRTQSAAMFKGKDCTLCRDPAWHVAKQRVDSNPIPEAHMAFHTKTITVMVAMLMAATVATAADEAPAGRGAPAARGEAGAPGTPGMPGARGAGRMGGAPPAWAAKRLPELVFEEKWTRAPQAQPMTQANLGNQWLTLHLYGDIDGIRKTYHPIEDYTYTGETKTNWAITVSDAKNAWDLSGAAKLMLRTRNSGYRFTHVIIRTADGKYYASEEGSGESSAWMNVEYIFSDLHWRSLLMTDTPTNASNKRAPDPKLVPIIPQARATPDLHRVDEVGFSDLMPGGWIPSTSRVNAFALYGKKVAR